MVRISTFEAKSGLASCADCVLGNTLLSFDHNRTVGPRAEPQVRVAPDVVQETEMNVSLPNFRLSHLREDKIFPTEHLAARCHAREGGGHSKRYLRLAVHLPALRAEAVLAAFGRSELCFGEMECTH